MGRYFRQYKVFVKQFFKSLIEYRVDFLVGLLAFLITQLAGIIFIVSIFQFIPALGGWDFYSVVFMYGVYLIPKGIDHLFTDTIWYIDSYVRNGELDRYLLRPYNVLFQLVSEKIDPNALGEILLGIGAIIYAVPNIEINLSVIDIFVVIPLFIIFSSLIYTSIKLFFMSIGFFSKRSIQITSVVYETSDYIKYPLNIYPTQIQFIFKFLIPFAFATYYPSIYLLGDKNPLYVIGTVAISLLSFTIAYIFFRYGLSKYESSGS